MKKVLVWSLAVMCTIGLTLPAFGEAPRNVNGVAVGDPADSAKAAENNAVVAPLGGGSSGSGYTGVDDYAPCYFATTFPMSKTWYKQYGIQFKGPNKLDGGALLAECDGWNITGFSSPNILAFNCESTLANGGHPVGPETLMFTPPVDAVQLGVGNGYEVGATVEVIAKSAEGSTVDSEIVSLSSTMQTVFLSGSKKIKKVIIGAPDNTSACAYAVDNIYWGTP